MLRKTHVSIGVTTALAVTKPDSVPLLFAGICTGVIGGIISDIDSDTSPTHKIAGAMIAASLFICVGIAALDHFTDLKILTYITANENLYRILSMVMIFFAVCAYGITRPHRTFMHSIFACVVLSYCIYNVVRVAYMGFFAAYISHLAIDLLNKKSEMLFWPIPRGISLGICKSDGLINKLLFSTGGVISILLIALSVKTIVYGFVYP